MAPPAALEAEAINEVALPPKIEGITPSIDEGPRVAKAPKALPEVRDLVERERVRSSDAIVVCCWGCLRQESKVELVQVCCDMADHRRVTCYLCSHVQPHPPPALQSAGTIEGPWEHNLSEESQISFQDFTTFFIDCVHEIMDRMTVC